MIHVNTVRLILWVCHLSSWSYSLNIYFVWEVHTHTHTHTHAWKSNGGHIGSQPKRNKSHLRLSSRGSWVICWNAGTTNDTLKVVEEEKRRGKNAIRLFNKEDERILFARFTQCLAQGIWFQALANYVAAKTSTVLYKVLGKKLIISQWSPLPLCPSYFSLTVSSIPPPSAIQLMSFFVFSPLHPQKTSSPCLIITLLCSKC